MSFDKHTPRNQTGESGADDEKAGYEAALRLITYRDRTVHELRTRLAKKGFSVSSIESAVERLKRMGYLDDHAYAGRYIAETLAARPAGRRFITGRLRQRGVHPDVVREALEHAYPEGAEEEMAYRVAAKRLRRTRNEEPAALRRKLTGYLSRRGFSYGDIQKAIRRVLGELDEDI